MRHGGCYAESYQRASRAGLASLLPLNLDARTLGPGDRSPEKLARASLPPKAGVMALGTALAEGVTVLPESPGRNLCGTWSASRSPAS
jgi:hypothetical protein